MSLRSWKTFAVLAAVALAGTALWQWNAVSSLRQEQEALLGVKAEADQLTADVAELEQLRGQTQNIEALRLGNRDLLGLRNEIGQLRRQHRELVQLQQENARLAAQLQSNPPLARSITEMPGFVARETWSFGDFSTPEAAVQSLLVALRDGNTQQFLDCAAPRAREQVLQQLKLTGQEGRLQQQMAGFEKMARVKGYRIADRTADSDDKVTVSVQLAAGSEPLKLPVRRYGQEWKIESF